MTGIPPLRLWLYSAVLAVATIGSMALYRQLSGERRDNTIAARTHAFLSTPATDGKLRVLALGSSLLWAATPQARLAEPSPLAGIAWLRMTKAGGGPGYLQSALKPVMRNPPDILVIEMNLLLGHSGNLITDELREETAQAGKRALSWLGAGLMAPSPSAYWEDKDQLQDFSCSNDHIRLTPTQLQETAVLFKAIYSPLNFDENLIDTLAVLKQRGVRIVILDLPRSPLAVQLAATQRQHWLAQLKTVLPASGSLSYLTYPAPQRQDLYCDLGHLNDRGARLFAPWWREQLLQLKQER